MSCQCQTHPRPPCGWCEGGWFVCRRCGLERDYMDQADVFNPDSPLCSTCEAEEQLQAVAAAPLPDVTSAQLRASVAGHMIGAAICLIVLAAFVWWVAR